MTSASMIVVDVPAGEAIDADLLSALDGPIMVCHATTGETCPTTDGRCGLADHSHGVVFEIDLEQPEHRLLLERYRRHLGPGIPIRVLVSAEQASRFGEWLRGFDVWTEGPFTPRRSH